MVEWAGPFRHLLNELSREGQGGWSDLEMYTFSSIGLTSALALKSRLTWGYLGVWGLRLGYL